MFEIVGFRVYRVAFTRKKRSTSNFGYLVFQEFFVKGVILHRLVVADSFLSNFEAGVAVASRRHGTGRTPGSYRTGGCVRQAAFLELSPPNGSVYGDSA